MSVCQCSPFSSDDSQTICLLLEQREGGIEEEGEKKREREKKKKKKRKKRKKETNNHNSDCPSLPFSILGILCGHSGLCLRVTFSRLSSYVLIHTTGVKR